MVAEVKGTAVTDYVRGITLICTDSEYYIYNAHGDVVSLTSTAGIVTKTYDYDAFGNEADPSDADTNPFRYCGEYYDIETGTYYLRARYYNPSLGRFGTEDPAHDGLNWYTYCHNDPINFKDSSGCTEYYVNGALPQFQFDHTFPYNPNAVATDADYYSWIYWGIMAFGSRVAFWLKDASKAYNHYRDNTGTDMWIDYERAYKEDSVISSNIDSQIETMKETVKQLYDVNFETSFSITGEIFGIPNGSSENWQKTIGAHQVFGVGNVTIDPKTGKATMIVTFYMEDMYNFNPGMSDIASGTPDDVNGRFSELGWAKEFKTYGSLTKTITWQLYNTPKNNGVYKNNSSRRYR